MKKFIITLLIVAGFALNNANAATSVFKLNTKLSTKKTVSFISKINLSEERYIVFYDNGGIYLLVITDYGATAFLLGYIIY